MSIKLWRWRQHITPKRRSVELKRNLMAHGEAREEKWRGKRRMEWVASTHSLYENTVYPALLPLMRTPRLPAADWTDTPADINGLVRFAGRPNPVSARVPSHSVFTQLEGGEWSAARLGRTLPPRKTRYPFYRKLGGPQGQSGLADYLVPIRIRSRTVQPVVKSLYRLSYPAHKETLRSPEIKSPATN